MSGNGVRVRFAPSPTGMLHIGGARTAIYNWAFARSCGGTFILRIEDTDPERSTEENTQIILRALRWLGLDWDEGPEVGGPAGPYFQTQRHERHMQALEELKASGNVYPCFCTKEQLDEDRARAQEDGGAYAGYCGRCRSIDPEEAASRIESGEDHVWRLKVPEEHAPIVFDDAVFGHMEFPADVMDDMVVVRTDGSPTFNFANVCDDTDMGITHVIRGDDHLSNTPRQILIYEALGRDVPTFAHLPMILGSDGKKLSKRHGATNVEEYRDHGYLADAMVNYLALLGWSLDGETTVIPPDVLCREFSLERITKKDSIFDESKLNWLDGAYIREMEEDDWFSHAAPWLAQSLVNGRSIRPGVTVIESLTKDEQAEAARNVPLAGSGVDPDEWQAALVEINEGKAVYSQTCPLVIERMSRFDEIPAKLSFLFWGGNVELDRKSMDKVLLKDGSRADEALSVCREVLSDADMPWDAEALQEKCRELGEARELKPKALFQPLRVAVCGNMVSPPLFESIVLMERVDVLARIDAVMGECFGGRA